MKGENVILNVGGMTDIVAFYTDWFMNRYHDGYLYVRNPFNESLVSRINFSDVDLIIFCAKNPYLKYIEPHVPNKKEIIKSVKILSKIIEK